VVVVELKTQSIVQVKTEDLSDFDSPTEQEKIRVTQSKNYDDATHNGYVISESKSGHPALYRVFDDCDYIVSGAIWVTGQARDPDGSGWCHVIKFIDQDERLRTLLMPRSLLAGDPNEILRRVLDMGFFIVPAKSAKACLISYLSSSVYARVTTSVNTGWQSDCQSFLLPDRVIGPGQYLLTNAPPINAPAGDLASWRKNISLLCVGNSRLIASICIGLASPLLELASIESGGFHLVGGSSSGKTTTAKLGCTVFGVILQSWRATDNGLEGVASRHSDIGLFLDDIGQVEPRIIGIISYMLANGAGKIRSDRDGSDKKVMKWLLLFLSTGEVTMSEHMASERKNAKAGQEVRLINLEADAGAGMGAFESLHGDASAKDFAERLNESSKNHYGTAGPAFIEFIVKNRNYCKSRITEIKLQFHNALNLKDSDGQVQRVATRFALIAAAGELASEAGITGWEMDAAFQASIACFKSWRKAWAPAGNREAQQAIEQVRGFMQKHAARFEDGDTPVPFNRAGFVKRNEYWIFPNVFRDDVCEGLRVASVTDVLMQRGYLAPDNEGKRQVRRTAEGKQQRFYVINSSILEGTDDEQTVNLIVSLASTCPRCPMCPCRSETNVYQHLSRDTYFIL